MSFASGQSCSVGSVLRLFRQLLMCVHSNWSGVLVDLICHGERFADRPQFLSFVVLGEEGEGGQEHGGE